MSESELRFFETLTTPTRIQTFLDEIPYSTEHLYRCPLRVLRERVAHCFDGALFAAATLEHLGHVPMILEMVPNGRDDDHLLTLYKRNGHWGAVAKSNYVGLRFREPVYRNLRELVMSYFEQFYNVDREKTLRSYSLPLNLKVFDKWNWMTGDESLEQIAQRLDRIRKIPLLTQSMVSKLSVVDERTYQTGLIGADLAGLYKPSMKKK
ncbi:MAG: hypothetical protein FJ110_01410 [Deltaproteobacteria bacterium]|nr:hypothetical protein [Deltaproteobacteria bacterium]